MKRFYRQIGNDVLLVSIDDLIFSSLGDTLINLLRAYQPLYKNVELLEKNNFYIIPEIKRQYYPRDQTYVIYKNDEKWLFNLINDLALSQIL